jgi:short-subunit dehydrogenase
MGAIVITGANRGIGLELARQLKARGGDIVAVCRSPSAELQALGVRVESGIDVSDASAVSELAKRLSGVSIDLLINNAGILRGDKLDAPNFDGIAEQFAVNGAAARDGNAAAAHEQRRQGSDRHQPHGLDRR